MQALSKFPIHHLQAIEYVLCDIDDTISTDGCLTPAAYSALWRLQNAGFKIIPVTGRPAGWCDHFARMWPINAIVGENGAFYFRYDPENKIFHNLHNDLDDYKFFLDSTLQGKHKLKLLKTFFAK